MWAICPPKGLGIQGGRGPSASYKNDGTFPQRVVQIQELSLWEPGGKSVYTFSPELRRDKSQGRADRGGKLRMCPAVQAANQGSWELAVDSFRRRRQTGEGKCRDPPSWRGPCSRLSSPSSTPGWQGEGRFSETLIRKPVKAPQASGQRRNHLGRNHPCSTHSPSQHIVVLCGIHTC